MKTGFKMMMVMLLLSITLIGCTRIDAGYMGLKVNLLGSERGDIEEYGPGRYNTFMQINTDWYKFPMFVKTYVWTADKVEGSEGDESFTFQTKEGLSINADIGISIQVQNEPGVPTKIFTTYRRGVDELIDSVIRNAVRDSLNVIASKYSVDDVIGEGKAKLLEEVEANVKAYFAPIGIDIVSLSWITSLRLPDQVVRALNAKIEASQIALQRENEVRTAEAEALKKVAEARGRSESVKLESAAKAESIRIEAIAQAEANRLLSQSMTATLLQLEWIKKWKGDVPTVSSDGGMILDMSDFKR
ncbi:MAG: SPFH domain-containing protein [Vulcanibacillus sp.]